MTRLELLVLQMKRSSKMKNFISDDWLFFWLLYKRETQVFEVASRRYLPLWERYQLEEAYTTSLSERAFEGRGARNDAPRLEQAQFLNEYHDKLYPPLCDRCGETYGKCAVNWCGSV